VLEMATERYRTGDRVLLAPGFEPSFGHRIRPVSLMESDRSSDLRRLFSDQRNV